MSGLDDALLENYMDGFYGYGNLAGPYWFVGMEEGGGDTLEEIQRRLAAWQERGQKVTEDLVDYHAAIGVTRYFGPQPKFQSTWSKLVRVLHILEDKPVVTDALRQTQGAEFGRSDGSSCLLELLPLPSPSTNHWLYGEHSRLAHIQNRETYRQTVMPKRVARLSAMIQRHRPRSVLFYGLGYRDHWQSISGQTFDELRIGKFTTLIGSNKHTLFVVAPHPTSTGITNAYFNAVGELMRERIL